jgi:hypothetical protein
VVGFRFSGFSVIGIKRAGAPLGIARISVLLQ